MSSYNTNQRGMTLIEVLIAILIMGLVAGLGYSMYFFMGNLYRDGADHSHIQKNVRLIEFVIKAELRNAIALSSSQMGLQDTIENLDIQAYDVEHKTLGLELNPEHSDEDTYFLKINDRNRADSTVSNIDLTFKDGGHRAILVFTIFSGDHKHTNEILLNNIEYADLDFDNDTVTLKSMALHYGRFE